MISKIAARWPCTKILGRRSGCGGGGGEVDDKDVSNGAGTGNFVQGSGTYGANIGERGLGSDGGNAEGDGGVPPSGGLVDSRYFRSLSWGGGMGLVIGNWC